jgi:hypothetical protein
MSNSGEFVIDDDLACAIRDRLLVIPGVREAARELGLLPGRVLHSACIGGPLPTIAQGPLASAAIGRPAPAALPPG